MNQATYSLLILTASVVFTLPQVNANPKPSATSFSRDVLPILEKRCTSCHGEEKAKSKFRLDTFDALIAGGKKGLAIAAGKSNDSPLVHRIEGRDGVKIMPPEKDGSPLRPEQIAIIRAWIDAGAANDKTGQSPAPQPAAGQEDSAPVVDANEVSALAFDPTGKWLARGGYQSVELLNAANGQVTATFTPHAETVIALAFSPDGKILAAGAGIPGQTGQVKLWDIAAQKEIRTIDAHNDLLYDVAFSPDGKTLATTSYDHSAKLWDVASGKLLKELKDHVDSVFDAAFSPDGQLLATVAADRTVKVWNVATGKRLYTLSDALKALNTVAFHPNGKQIAAAGADKMIRVWNITPVAGTLAQTTFAHDGPVLRLIYSPDGKTLYSTAQDRMLKAWNAESLTEINVFERQSDWAQALALSPDGKRIAAGRYDGSLSVYDTATTKLVFDDPTDQPGPKALVKADTTQDQLAAEDDDPFRGGATAPGSLSSISPRGATRGQTVTITLWGKNLEAAEFLPLGDGLTAKVTKIEAGKRTKPARRLATAVTQVIDAATPYTVTAELTIAEDAAPGIRGIRLVTKSGASNQVNFAVEDRLQIAENKDNSTLPKAQRISADALIVGKVDRAGDEDYYAFNAKAGQELVFRVVASALGSGLKSQLTLLNSHGRVLADSNEFTTDPDARLGYRFDADGAYILRLVDRLLNSGGFYRLHVGEFGMVTHVDPLSLQAGTSREFTVRGFNLVSDGHVYVDAPKSADGSTTVFLPVKPAKERILFNRRVAVGRYDHVTDAEPNDTPAQAQAIAAPVHVIGAMDDDGLGHADVDYFRFSAQKDQRLIVDVDAHQIGSLLDSTIEILDAEGHSIERATIRCVAETIFVLSGRTSASTGWRLQSWADFAMNDYLMAGNEIVRIRALPDYSDEDVLLARNTRNARRTFFGTTPEFHEVGEKAYKIELHPPGKTFPSNGMPVYRIYHRNDDGGNPLHQKDSRFVFDPPADRDYIVKITDVSGRVGSRYSYRLNIRPPQPDYRLRLSRNEINLPAGGNVDVRATVDRFDDFAGPIHVKFEKLPKGITITEGTILENLDTVTLTLSAAPDAVSTEPGTAFKAVAVADINGQQVTREARIGRIHVAAPADIDITLTPQTVTLVPGGPVVEVAIDINRRNGFIDRVRMDVQNLPYGVAVQNTGLNGILVRKNESHRTFKLRAEPWVQSIDRPILVVGTIEARSPVPTTFSSPTILLKIAKEKQITKADK